jgi:hypothetical protein
LKPASRLGIVEGVNLGVTKREMQAEKARQRAKEKRRRDARSTRLGDPVSRMKGAPLHHYTSKVQRISEILQFPIIVEGRRLSSLDPQPFKEIDFFLGHRTAE